MRKSTNILSRPTKGQWGFMLLFGLPPFLLFVFITVVPMIRSVIYSFYAGDGVTWVGFNNYAVLLSDPNFYAPMLNDFLILRIICWRTLTISCTRWYTSIEDKTETVFPKNKEERLWRKREQHKKRPIPSISVCTMTTF